MQIEPVEIPNRVRMIVLEIINELQALELNDAIDRLSSNMVLSPTTPLS